MRCPALIVACLVAVAPCAAQPRADAVTAARYDVRIASAVPLRVDVDATLPSAGDRLAMSTTRPGDIAELDAGGWPAVVHDLRVQDADGRAIATTPAGADGWKLAHAVVGPIMVHYTLDYAPLATLGWPAPRESVYADDATAVLAGRAVFASTPAQQASRVRIRVPAGWHVAAPWPRGHGGTFAVATVDDLVDNLFAASRATPDRIAAGRFAVTVVAVAQWQAVRADVRRILAPIADGYVRAMPVAGDQSYLVVLLPQREHGGESFRNSFAMNLDADPSRANLAQWGNTLAHEVFHYWNGWRLRGGDYAATQWFQEGFTEYAANKALLTSHVATPDDFMRQLAKHIDDDRKLATPLDVPGTHKGPALYGGGALIAFCWDVQLRVATRGRRTLRDMFAALWTATDRGAKPYDWAAIRAALASVADGDWDAFHARYVSGREPPPVDDALRALGLRRIETQDMDVPVRVEPDPKASDEARKAWAEFVAR